MPKVLVVDDSLSVRKVVERALGTKRIDVLSAASGKEAIEQIGHEEPDLIVCDVIMPDMDGYQICDYVKTHPHLGGTPVLLISGIVNSTVLERAAAVRSDDVMRKPFTADELLTKIDTLLESSKPAAPAEPEAAPPAVEAVAFMPEPSPPVPAPPHESRAPLADLKTVLAKLAALPGVSLSVIVDRDGFLIESAGEMLLEAEVAGALASCLAESSEGIGRELGQGKFQGMILEYEAGLVILNGVDPTTMLAVVLRDAAALGKVRYYVKKALPELAGAL
ncbi:MAG TPA: response regulator [Methylomirabilota bacterium]|jgi:CheY-like chemotaxis protein|nr:response regulator [Methylomirabilota bacterium]